MDTTASSSENPLRAGMRLERVAPPCVVVIFGATGDLTRRKLLPALFRLTEQRLIPAEFAILGTARHAMSDDEFRAQMQQAIKEFADDENFDESTWQSFAKRLFYIGGEFNDTDLYAKLKSKLDEIDTECNTRGNRLFYLATAPDNFGLIAGQLGKADLAKPKQESWTRIIVEKPFGHDLESARVLNQQLAAVFDESRSTASIIISAKRRCRTCWSFVLPTAFSSRCGTGNTSITFKSQTPRRSASKVAALTTKRPAPCAT